MEKARPRLRSAPFRPNAAGYCSIVLTMPLALPKSILPA